MFLHSIILELKGALKPSGNCELAEVYIYIYIHISAQGV